MNELALFAGAGGGILGGKLLGWRTVCAVELNAYAASVLCARQNDGLLPPFPIWDDVCTFDGRPWRGVVDVVSGGFPCQDISVAGGGAGISGERSGLWKEFARIIREVRPGNVLVENSPALTSRGLDVVLGDLAALGYDAEWGVLGAADVGAPHQRDRIWIVAYSAQHMRDARRAEPAGQQRQTWAADGGDDVAHAERAERLQEGAGQCGDQGRQHADSLPERKEDAGRLGAGREVVADANEEHDDRSRFGAGPFFRQRSTPAKIQICHSMLSGPPKPEQEWQHGRPASEPSWWATEPAVGRVVNGLAARVDRLTALGNGQVPACAAEAFRRLTLYR